MKLKNGDEIEVDGQKYRVIGNELHEINKGFPPALVTIEPIEREVPICDALRNFYLKKGYDVCPNCGLGREAEGGTGCGEYHEGAYCRL